MIGVNLLDLGDATQVSALLVDQLSALEPPLVTELGLAVKLVMAGAGDEPTYS